MLIPDLPAEEPGFFLRLTIFPRHLTPSVYLKYQGEVITLTSSRPNEILPEPSHKLIFIGCGRLKEALVFYVSPYTFGDGLFDHTVDAIYSYGNEKLDTRTLSLLTKRGWSELPRKPLEGEVRDGT